MDGGRVLHAELDLLDHQLRDRAGRLCGKVDDLASSQAERWVREHAIRRIPGSRHEAE